MVNNYNYPDNFYVVEDSPNGLGVYHLSIFQLDSAKNKIDNIKVSMICADLEGAEYQNTAHFPVY